MAEHNACAGYSILVNYHYLGAVLHPLFRYFGTKEHIISPRAVLCCIVWPIYGGEKALLRKIFTYSVKVDLISINDTYLVKVFNNGKPKEITALSGPARLSNLDTNPHRSNTNSGGVSEPQMTNDH